MEMKFRHIKNRPCPNPGCKKVNCLTAVEIKPGFVSTYHCEACGAVYDAEVLHDFERKEHWWIGRLRNPDYWNVTGNPSEGGEVIFDLAEKEAKGIKDYLGTYYMERIS